MAAALPNQPAAEVTRAELVRQKVAEV